MGQSLTERLHRGTQASIRMHRGQLANQSAHGLEESLHEPSYYTPKLGKRTFGGAYDPYQDAFYQEETPLYDR